MQASTSDLQKITAKYFARATVLSSKAGFPTPTLQLLLLLKLKLPAVCATLVSCLSSRPKTTSVAELHHVAKTTQARFSLNPGPSRLVSARTPATHPGPRLNTACQTNGKHAKENCSCPVRQLSRATSTHNSILLLRMPYAPAGAATPHSNQAVFALLAFPNSPARLKCTVRAHTLERLS